MAKNKVEIDVIIDDKGTTGKVGLGAKAAAKGLDDTAKSSRDAQKGIKGVAGTASAGGKNFAGMARGMDGVVGAYASFAAQMFALSAAFGFLKRAGDLAVMQAGQTTYASATGIAMRTLTNDIIAATGAQITFRDAAQAVAIGTAAGVTTDQLERLGKAAKDTSAVLGRDVTDSFNRLIKGVTKAEPELLDELGIILRLDTASKNYAETLGKSVKDLTQFEKSQAVVNEVLSQSESKYSRIQDVMGGSQANPFAQLGKAFDDIIMLIQNGLLPVFGSLAKVLTDVPLLAIAGFGLLAKGPLKAMGFSMDGLVTKSVANAAAAKSHWEAEKLGALDATKAVEIYTASLQKQTLAAMSNKETPNVGTSKIMNKVGAGTALSKKETSQLANSLTLAKKKLGKDGKVISGIFKGFTSEALLSYERMVAGIKVANKKLSVDAKVTTKGLSFYFASMSAFVQGAVAKMGAAMMTLMSWAGWISLVVMALMMLKDAFIKPREITDTEKAFTALSDKVQSLNQDYLKLIEVQKIMIETQDQVGLISIGSALGNVAGSVNQTEFANILDFLDEYNEKAKITKQTQQSQGLTRDSFSITAKLATGKVITEAREFVDNDDYKKANEEYRKYIDTQITLTSELEGAYGTYEVYTTYRNALNSIGTDSQATVKELQAARVAVMELGSEFASLDKLQKASRTAMSGIVQSFAPQSAEFRAIKDFDAEIKALETTMAKSQERGKLFEEITPFGLYQGDSRNDAEREQDARMAMLKLERDFVKTIGEERHAQKLQASKANTAMAAALDVQEITERKISTLKANELNKLALIEKANVDQRAFDDYKVKKLGEVTTEMLREEEIRKEVLKKYGIELETLQEKIKLSTELQAVEKTINELKVDQGLLQKEKQLLGFAKQQLDILKRRQKLEKEISDRKIKDSISEEEGPGGGLIYRERIAAELKAQEARKAFDDKSETGTIELIKAEFKHKIDMQTLANKENMVKYQILAQELSVQKIKAKNTAAEFRRIALEQSLLATKSMKMVPGGMGMGSVPQETEKSKAAKAASDEANRQAGVTDGTITELTDLQRALTDILALAPDQGIAILKLLDDEQIAALKAAGLLVGDLEQEALKLQPIQVLLKDLGASVHDNMNSAFTAMVTGAKSAKDAFADMAKSILKDLTAMIVKAMILQMFGGSTFGNFLGLGKARNGGIFEQGKKLSGYATGGVARGSTSGYPVMMHGTEAIVPLPNGKSIPVQMSGNGGSTNNIVVNISTEGQSSKEGSSGPDMDKLGGAIATAVQVELQNQKRSGGILNPYGVA